MSVCICQLWFCSFMTTHLYPRLHFLLSVLTVILPAANFYKSERVLWNGEQTTLSCPGLCVQIVYTYNFISCVCLNVCEFVSVCKPAGLGNRWRFRANSADAGVENPAMELRLWGESAAADWGPGWRMTVGG